MNYIQTFEHYSFGSDLNEASENSVKNLQDRIKQLTDTGTKLKAKNFNDLIAKKKASINKAKEQKDNLKTQIAEREMKITELRSQKHELRLGMIRQEIMFLNQKLTYQQESVKIKSQIEKLKQ